MKHFRILAWLIIAVCCGNFATPPRVTVAAINMQESSYPREVQVTHRPTGHILTNVNVWSPDGEWIVYDARSDAAGEKFDGSTIEMVNANTGEVREIYRSTNGAHCGVATFCPSDSRVAFILGPENPTSDWQYSPWHRQGAIVDPQRPHSFTLLDARDLSPPFTAGALRGGSHVHIFNAHGDRISFTYEDHVLATADGALASHELNQRNVGVSLLGRRVQVKKQHPRNHDGDSFTVLVTRTVDRPHPGSDEISRACEESWIGTRGYTRPDGTRQSYALSFQGQLLTSEGREVSEVFVVDLPDDLTAAGELPLAGTATTRPAPPRGTVQRRVTYTADRKYPGIQGPRHWLRTAPDGSRIAFLMRDDQGVVQIWLVSPNGGEPRQLTRNAFDIGSAFTWSSDGESLACVADNSVFTFDASTGIARRLTPRVDDAWAPRPEACVFSPDARRIAYVRRVTGTEGTFNQVFLVDVQ